MKLVPAELNDHYEEYVWRVTCKDGTPQPIGSSGPDNVVTESQHCQIESCGVGNSHVVET